MLQVNTSKKACVAVYPTIEQNQILWFWPNSASQYKDIAVKEKPPYIPELNDPSFMPNTTSSRDIPYGEGGRPLEITLQTSDLNGFFAKEEAGYSKFVPPCLFYVVRQFGPSNGSTPSGSMKEEPSENQRQQGVLVIFMCVPVSPGNSRLIELYPTKYGSIVPRWVAHLGQNLILDSDLRLLHLQEHKINDAGLTNWQKVSFVPTKADAMVIAFRMWLRKYSGGQFDWGTKFSGYLPPTPPKEQLLD
ncbi:Protochlorophyllide-dependent translocon component 52 protein, partial [Thalictrum thalictroides]